MEMKYTCFVQKMAEAQISETSRLYPLIVQLKHLTWFHYVWGHEEEKSLFEFLKG